MDTLTSKQDFLQQLEGLTYEERAARAAEFGRKFKDSQELDPWIAHMRKHPPPEVPQSPTEEGFTENFPPQQLNIAKHYLEDQVAITVAVAAKKTSLLLQELSSPSKWFKPVAAKAVVSELVKTDEGLDTLEKKILSSPPATRKKLLMHLIREKKTALLDKLYPRLYEHKPETAIGMVHGCSSEFLKEKLMDADYIHLPQIRWKKVAQFHGPLLIDLMRSELEDAGVWHREHVWSKWWIRLIDARPQFLYKARMTKAVWALYEEFPCVSDKYNLKTPSDEKTYQYRFPLLFTNHRNHFLKECASEIYKWLIQHTDLDCRGILRWPFPSVVNIHHKLLVEKHLKFYFELVQVALNTQEVNPAPQNYSHTFASIYEEYVGIMGRAKLTEALEMFPLYIQLKKKMERSYSPTTDGLTEICGNLDTHFVNMHKKGCAIRINEKDFNLDKMLTYLDTQTMALAKMLELNHAAFPAYFATVASFSKNQTITSFPFATRDLFSFVEEYPHIEFIAKLLEVYGGFIAKQEEVEKDKSQFVESWSLQFAMMTTLLLKGLNKIITGQHWIPYSEEQLAKATKLRDEIFNLAISHFKIRPIENFITLRKMCPFLPVEHRIKIYEIYSFSHFETLAEQDELHLILKYLPNETYSKHVTTLSTSENLSERSKLAFQQFRDLSDHAQRKELQKVADSNNDTQRKDAIFALIASTIHSTESQLVVQHKRTLNFMRTKLKNEKIEMRLDGLEAISTAPQDKLFPPGVNQEIFDIYYALLQDAIEVKDLDSLNSTLGYEHGNEATHPIFKCFFRLSHAAIQNGFYDRSTGLFDFGVELQWRIATFRHRIQEAVKTFTINLPDRRKLIFRKHADKHNFVDAYFHALESRLAKRNPKWAENAAHWPVLFKDLLLKGWSQNQRVLEFLKGLVDNIKNAKKDLYGMSVVKPTNVALPIFEHIFKTEKSQALNFPIVNDYIQAMLRSTQAKVVVFQWIKLREHDKRRKAQKQVRDESVKQLLEITPSAIHLNFVWRHLMRWRPTRLDPFINAKNPFRGVFYVEHTERRFRPIAPVAAPPAPRSAPKRRVRVPVPVPEKVVSETTFAPVKNVVEVPKKEKELKAQKKMEKELLTNPDHPDFFILKGSRGLTRFLPSQIEKLAEQWLSIALNRDASIPVREKACKQWTIMPTVTYANIVKVYSENKRDVKNEDGEVVQRALEVNLVESLLQGTACNDEPLAPLNYLLTTTFLSSDLARVAAFVMQGAVAHLQGTGLTDILKMCLTGKRREALKVTVYKAIINLLASTPTPKHIAMVEHEQNRAELHRDVRIQIVKAAFGFLKKNTEQSVKLAWEILKTTISKTKNEWKYISEVLTVLLGVKAEEPNQKQGRNRFISANTNFDINANVFELNTLVEHLDAFARVHIPTQFVEKFTKEIVVPVCSSAEDEDVRVLAMFVLFNFRKVSGVADIAAQQYRDFLIQTEHRLFNSTKEKERQIYIERWKGCFLRLLALTGCDAQTRYEAIRFAPKSYVTTVIQTTCARLAAIKPDGDSTKRVLLYGLVKHITSKIDVPDNTYWDDSIEEEFTTPFKQFGELFWKFLTQRWLVRFHNTWGSAAPYKALSDKIIGFMEFASKRIGLGEWLVTKLTNFIASVPYTQRWCKAPFLVELVDPARRDKLSVGARSVMIRSVFGILNYTAIEDLFTANRQSAMLNFMDYGLAQCSKGTIHDHTKHIAVELYNIIHHNIENRYSNEYEPLSPLNHQLVNHYLKLLKPVGPNQDITTLSIIVQFTSHFLSHDPLLFAKSGDHVGHAIHWLITEQTAVTKGASETASHITQMLDAIIYKYKSILPRPDFDKSPVPASVVAFIAALLDSQLSTFKFDDHLCEAFNPDAPEVQPKNMVTESVAFQRVAMDISFAVLAKFPEFVIWMPQCFQRFFMRVMEAQLAEPISTPARYQMLADILIKGYFQYMARGSVGPKNREEAAKHALVQVNKLLEMDTKHPVFVRTICARWSVVLGYFSALQQEDKKYVWVSEFQKLLVRWLADTDGGIQDLAFETNTQKDLKATDYAGLVDKNVFKSAEVAKVPDALAFGVNVDRWADEKEDPLDWLGGRR